VPSTNPPHDHVACDRCGADAGRPATRLQRLRRWVRDGSGGGRVWHCARCGATWGDGRAVLYGYRPAGFGRTLRAPKEVLDAVRWARHWHPVPVFYLGVAGVALVPAAAIGWLTPVRWWVALPGVPAAAVTCTFLLSLRSGLGRQGRRDVLMRLAPQRAMARELEDDLDGLRRELPGLTLLAPAAWDGELAVAGCGWSVPRRGPRELREVVVMADQGDPALEPGAFTPGWRPARPRLELRTSRDPMDQPDELGTARQLAADLLHPEVFDDADLPELAPDGRPDEAATMARFDAFERAVEDRAASLTDRFRDVLLEVDGEPVAAHVLSQGTLARGWLPVDGQVVAFSAEDVEVEGLALRRVTDPTPLVAAYETRRQRLLGSLTPS
jgi:hypothetical protein